MERLKLIALMMFILIMLGIDLYSKDRKELLKENFSVKEIISVYDGDTFRAELNCKTKFFCNNMSIRVYGIDTPEKRGGTKTGREKHLAHQAQQITEAFVTSANPLYLDDCIKGKYFRLVCKVRNEKGIYLSDILLKYNLAVPYFGGTKVRDWSR